MAFRFFAIAWNSTSPPHRSSAQSLLKKLDIASGNWRPAVKADGLAVYYTGARPRSADAYSFANGQGVVLGKLFRQQDDTAATIDEVILGARESAEIVSSGGRYLMERFWGGYVGFAYDAANKTTWVFKDPTARLRCFETSFEGVAIFFSDIEDCCATGLRFTINADYVRAHLVQSNIVESRETGLAEVSKVLGGESIRLCRGRATRMFCWDPRNIARRDAIEDHKEAIERLRHTVRSSVHAWASCYNSILLRLSGGLDSSIVLSCLQHAPTKPRVTCLNFYSSIDPLSDERTFARMVAEQAHCELLELDHSLAVDLRPIRQGWRKTPRPNAAHTMYLLAGHCMLKAAAEKGCEAVFSGDAGDELFSKSQVILAAGDYASRHGLRRTLLDVTLDVARLEGLSIWRVVQRGVLPGLFRRARWHPDVGRISARNRRLNILVNEELRNGSYASSTHPWLEPVDGVPTGKLNHIRAMCCLSSSDERTVSGNDPEYVRPLHSQPLIELCLRIPTYLQVRGGWDRSIARRAFADCLPREIVARRTKGGGSEFDKAVVARNVEFLREFLFGGVLMDMRILDPSALEVALSCTPSDMDWVVPQLLQVIDTEAWLRTWRTAPQANTTTSQPHTGSVIDHIEPPAWDRERPFHAPSGRATQPSG